MQRTTTLNWGPLKVFFMNSRSETVTPCIVNVTPCIVNAESCRLSVSKMRRDSFEAVPFILAFCIFLLNMSQETINFSCFLMNRLLTEVFFTMPQTTNKKLYVQYVRPHLEFAVAAWSPWLEADKSCLEKNSTASCVHDIRPEGRHI